MDRAKEIALKLLQINAIKLSPQNPFTWASGIRSPIYCDNRIVLSYPEIRQTVADAFLDEAGRITGANVVAGVATAGVPHGAILAYRMGVPFVYVRDKSKSHGRQNQIEGELPPNPRAIVVEDLISTGGSSLKAIEALQQAGCEIAMTLAIFSYELPQAREAFSAAGISYTTLSNYPVLLQSALETGSIDSATLELLDQWRIAPEKWQGPC